MWLLLKRVPVWAYVAVLVLGAASAYVANLKAQVSGLREEVRETGLALDSTVAAHDTTRMVLMDSRDSTATWQRRAIQAELGADEVDEALAQETRARLRVEAAFREFRAQVTSAAPVMVVDHDTRTAEFEVRDAPYTVTAHVELPPPPASATGVFEVKLDPLLFGVRVGCQDVDGRTIRAAVVGLTDLPVWVTPEISEVQQDPGVCNPESAPPQGLGLVSSVERWVGRATILSVAAKLLYDAIKGDAKTGT